MYFKHHLLYGVPSSTILQSASKDFKREGNVMVAGERLELSTSRLWA